MAGEKRPASLRERPRAKAGASSLALGLMAAAVALSAGDAAAQEADAHEMVLAQQTPIVVPGRRPGANPYADPSAPFRVERLANDKFTEPLVDTPKSVQVISDDVLDALGATTFRDVARTQPGVTLGTGEGGNAFGDRIFIRGFDARNDIYIDGVRDPGVGARETFAVQQIEILKGPSSSFAGRGTTGGAVSLVSKQPTNENWGDVEAGIGTQDTHRVTVDLNRALTSEFKVRLNGLWHEGGIAGRNEVFNNRWGWAAAAAYDPSDAVSLGFDYYHLSTDEMPDWGFPYDVANGRPFNVARDNFYGVLARDFRRTFADIYTGRAKWRLSDAAEFNAALRYGQTGNAYVASAPERPNTTDPDPANWTVSANAKRRDSVTEYWAGQASLTLRFDTGAVRHTAIFGADASNETVLNRQRAFTECAVLPCTGTTSNPLQNLLNPDPHIAWAVTDAGILSRINIEVDSVGVYALDTVKFGEQWELQGGVRYDTYDIDLDQLIFATNTLNQRSNKAEFWNGHLGLVYKLRENMSLYAALASSSNPSGEQLDSLALDYGGLDVRTQSLDPERNRSYELGFKWNAFDEHLALTAAVFRIEKENARVAVDPTTVALVGKQRADGVELSAAGNVTDAWSVFGGLTWLDAKVEDSPLAGQSGARFPNVPEWSFSLLSRHEITDRFYVGGAVTYNSRRYGGTVVANANSIPEYWRFDAFAGFHLTDDVELKLNALNITDELYYDALYRSATPFVYVAPGRSFMLEIDYDF